MKIGICADTSKLGAIKELGYDYIELALVSVANMSDEDFELCAKALEDSGLKSETFNCFCSPDIRLSSNADLEKVEAYAKKAIARAARLGGRVIVVGSGGARKVPDGEDFEAAKESFIKVLTVIARIAAEYDIKVAIEPLNPSETNLANTVADAAEIAQAAGVDNLGYIVDLYHFYLNGEDFSDIEKYKDRIFHTHIARMNADRRIPTMEDGESVKQFFDKLKAIDYQGRMSLEGAFHPDFETSCAEAMKLFKHFELK